MVTGGDGDSAVSGTFLIKLSCNSCKDVLLTNALFYIFLFTVRAAHLSTFTFYKSFTVIFFFSQ